ncbi:hypothetical protein [Nonomuraea sp. NPDC002799]
MKQTPPPTFKIGSMLPICPPGQVPARCPVSWCKSLHIEGDDLHYGNGEDFVVVVSPLDDGRPTQRATLSVSLEQMERTGQLMVAMDPPGPGGMYLTRDDAKRLALALLRLDLDANGVAP